MTLDFSCCKQEDTISWIYCRNAYDSKTTQTEEACLLSSLDASSTCPNMISKTVIRDGIDYNGPKCDDYDPTQPITYSVPSTASGVVIQLHDGQFIGQSDQDSCPQHPVTQYWAGGCSGKCGSAACQVNFDFTKCPNPQPYHPLFSSSSSLRSVNTAAATTATATAVTNAMNGPNLVSIDVNDSETLHNDEKTAAADVTIIASADAIKSKPSDQRYSLWEMLVDCMSRIFVPSISNKIQKVDDKGNKNN